MDSLMFAVGILGAAYAGGYFQINKVVDSAIYHHDYASLVPVIAAVITVGLLAHHQRQTPPIPKE